MSEALANELDLELAWARVLHDLRDGRTFVVPPFLRQLVDRDRGHWLGQIQQHVLEDTYQASPLRVADVPKPKGAIRPGCILSLEDHVLFTALVGRLDPEIREAVNWGEQPPDYAYRLHEDAGHLEWFEPHFRHWKEFDQHSLELLNEGYEFVVELDIAGYYEQIDLAILRSDLNALGGGKEALNLLMRCLHRWSESEKRGIPQGHSAADILAKLYLNSVDRALADMGLTHIRWVDDYRIFTRTRAEAREGLVRVTRLLRARGLVVQSAKTKILSAEVVSLRLCKSGRASA